MLTIIHSKQFSRERKNIDDDHLVQNKILV